MPPQRSRRAVPIDPVRVDAEHLEELKILDADCVGNGDSFAVLGKRVAAAPTVKKQAAALKAVVEKAEALLRESPESSSARSTALRVARFSAALAGQVDTATDVRALHEVTVRGIERISAACRGDDALSRAVGDALAERVQVIACAACQAGSGLSPVAVLFATAVAQSSLPAKSFLAAVPDLVAAVAPGVSALCQASQLSGDRIRDGISCSALLAAVAKRVAPSLGAALRADPPTALTPIAERILALSGSLLRSDDAAHQALFSVAIAAMCCITGCSGSVTANETATSIDRSSEGEISSADAAGVIQNIFFGKDQTCDASSADSSGSKGSPPPLPQRLCASARVAAGRSALAGLCRSLPSFPGLSRAAIIRALLALPERIHEECVPEYGTVGEVFVTASAHAHAASAQGRTERLFALQNLEQAVSQQARRARDGSVLLRAVNGALAAVWSHWEHPVSNIASRALGLLERLLALVADARADGRLDGAAAQDWAQGVAAHIVGADWDHRGKYRPLAALVPHVGAEFIITCAPDIVYRAMTSRVVVSAPAAVATLLAALVQNDPARVPWISTAAAVLCSARRDAVDGLCEHVIPSLALHDGSALHSLLWEVQGHPAAVVGVLRIAQRAGNGGVALESADVNAAVRAALLHRDDAARHHALDMVVRPQRPSALASCAELDLVCDVVDWCANAPSWGVAARTLEQVDRLLQRLASHWPRLQRDLTRLSGIPPGAQPSAAAADAHELVSTTVAAYERFVRRIAAAVARGLGGPAGSDRRSFCLQLLRLLDESLCHRAQQAADEAAADRSRDARSRSKSGSDGRSAASASDELPSVLPIGGPVLASPDELVASELAKVDAFASLAASLADAFDSCRVLANAALARRGGLACGALPHAAAGLVWGAAAARHAAPRIAEAGALAVRLAVRALVRNHTCVILPVWREEEGGLTFAPVADATARCAQMEAFRDVTSLPVLQASLRVEAVRLCIEAVATTCSAPLLSVALLAGPAALAVHDLSTGVDVRASVVALPNGPATAGLCLVVPPHAVDAPNSLAGPAGGTSGTARLARIREQQTLRALAEWTRGVTSHGDRPAYGAVRALRHVVEDTVLGYVPAESAPVWRTTLQAVASAASDAAALARSIPGLRPPGSAEDAARAREHGGRQQQSRDAGAGVDAEDTATSMSRAAVHMAWRTLRETALLQGALVARLPLTPVQIAAATSAAVASSAGVSSSASAAAAQAAAALGSGGGGADGAAAAGKPERRRTLRAALGTRHPWSYASERAAAAAGLHEELGRGTGECAANKGVPWDVLPMSANDAAACGDALLEVLLAELHRGVLEKTHLALLAVASTMLACEDSYLRQLPGAWLEQLLGRVRGTSAAAHTVNRRSAGLSFALLALLGAEPSGRPRSLLPRAADVLLQLAHDRSASPMSRVHALNLLKYAFEDASLAHALEEYVARGMLVCAEALASQSWDVRNSASMCLAALVQRALGGRRRDGAHGGLTLREFSARFGDALEAFRVHLADASGSHTSALALLAILARLHRGGGGTGEDAASRAHARAFGPLIDASLSHRNAHVRALAARAAVALVPLGGEVAALRRYGEWLHSDSSGGNLVDGAIRAAAALANSAAVFAAGGTGTASASATTAVAAAALGGSVRSGPRPRGVASARPKGNAFEPPQGRKEPAVAHDAMLCRAAADVWSKAAAAAQRVRAGLPGSALAELTLAVARCGAAPPVSHILRAARAASQKRAGGHAAAAALTTAALSLGASASDFAELASGVLDVRFAILRHTARALHGRSEASARAAEAARAADALGALEVRPPLGSSMARRALETLALAVPALASEERERLAASAACALESGAAAAVPSGGASRPSAELAAAAVSAAAAVLADDAENRRHALEILLTAGGDPAASPGARLAIAGAFASAVGSKLAEPTGRDGARVWSLALNLVCDGDSAVRTAAVDALASGGHLRERAILDRSVVMCMRAATERIAQRGDGEAAASWIESLIGLCIDSRYADEARVDREDDGNGDDELFDPEEDDPPAVERVFMAEIARDALGFVWRRHCGALRGRAHLREVVSAAARQAAVVLRACAVRARDLAFWPGGALNRPSVVESALCAACLLSWQGLAELAPPELVSDARTAAQAVLDAASVDFMHRSGAVERSLAAQALRAATMGTLPPRLVCPVGLEES